MEVCAIAILALFSIVGFAAIFLTTFGTLIILIGALLYAGLTEFAVLGVRPLVILLVLYLFGEVAEYVFVIFGAKKSGASNVAVIGALIGGVLGALIGAGLLGVGVILGTFLGIFLGAFLVEFLVQRDLVKSLKAGAGSVLGRIGSILVKVLLAIIMFIVIIVHIINHPSAVQLPVVV